MNCANRIKMIQMIDKMNDLPEFTKKLRLEDVSTFQEISIHPKNEMIEKEMVSC